LIESFGLLLTGVAVGGFIRGFVGFGGPMTVIPLLAIYYPPAVAIWIMALIDFPPNAFLIPSTWRYAKPQIYLPLIIGTVLTLAIGVYGLVMIDAVLMRRIISVAIILACLLLLSGWMYRGRVNTGGWLAVGALSGLVAGATLIAVVTSVFLNAASRDLQANRANFIFWGFALSIVLITLLALQQDDLLANAEVIGVMAVVYFLACGGGAIAQRHFQHPVVRQLTLVLIILIATSTLLGSYGFF
jgi:uncharacterized membrane protein YfcA